MQNDSIVITAKLNVDASEGLILKDLEKIQGDLAKKPLQINCAISDTALKNIQNQLSSMAKGLTLDIGKVNAQAIQQSINDATKAQPVNITTQINKAEIKRQAEEIKNDFGLLFPKDEAKALDAELRKILTDFDSAFKSSNAREMQNNLEKLTSLCFKYDSGLDEVTRSMREQEGELQRLARAGKVYISEIQKGDLLNKFGGDKSAVSKYLTSKFGVGGFTYDKSKATTAWDKLAMEMNERLNSNIFNVNASSYDDVAKINTSDIVKGLEDYENIISQSMKVASDALKNNGATWQDWQDTIYNALMKFQGVESSPVGEFVEIFSDEQIAKTEQNVQKLAQAFHSIEAAKAAYKSDDVKSVTADWALDAERNIKGFTINVTKANGEIERLHHTIDEMGQVQLLGSNVSDRGVDKLLERANSEADKLERKLININAAALDQNAARPIKTEEGKNAIAQAYNDAIDAVNKLRQADATTFAELDNEAKKAVDNLNNVVRAQRNAETAATKLRTQHIDVIREEELAGLNRFVADVSKSAIPNVEVFKERVQELREQLSKVGDNDKQGLADYLDRFSVLNSTFKAVNEQARVATSALKELDKISGNKRFAQNSQNANVQSALSEINSLKAEYQQLFESLGKNNAPENLQQISVRLAELKPRFDAVRQSASDLNRELANNSLSQDAAKRLNNLTNQINTFANTNKKATESLRQMRSGVTFADEWKRITDVLKSGNLDDNAIRQLTADFQNFKGEARSVGNVTNTVFTNMGGQIQMLMSRWLSLYAVIGKIKQMITYVIELDDAMTKLRRVTDETAEGYERFLEVAKKSAKETNTTLVDTVEQAAKWAKSGYDAATSAQLAKTSLIYSIVGDIDNDTAVSDLVTALRGFRLEAEDAMSIVDKLDALNNKYATDAKSLGEALTVSASAMANAGNDLDQTLALITGATEITQNAKETGQAIRTITMRIRGMKGELQELGEESDGIESISKIQTQILNYTKGKVNIFDRNNEFKSTYQILKEISDVFNELSQTDQAALTEVIFGKLRANQGLAVISAFQSGQIEKALKDSRSAAGTATEEMERYAESISGHLNLFKEAVQELSADLIDGELVKSFIDDGKELIELTDNLIKDIKEIKDLIPQVVKDIYNGAKGNSFLKEIINPISTIIDAYDGIRGKVKGKDLLVDALPESTEKIDSLTDRYLELYATGENVSSMSTQLGDLQDNLNDKYNDASKAIDVMNKSLSENLAITEQLKREEVGKWLEENTEDYRKAIEELEKSTKIRTDAFGNMIGGGDAYTLNAAGLGGYTKSQYEAFAKLGLSNYHSAEGGVFTYDFALSGTLQEQLDSLIKIRDVYSTLDDQDEKRLRQMNSEIESLQDKIKQNKELNDILKEQQQLYASLQAGGQKYNMIEQAKIAYDEYQKALETGDSTAASNALTMLNTVKDTLYSVTEPTDLVRQQFNQLWDTFALGSAEAISAIDDVKQRFAELSGDEFDNTLKNVTAIESAIESIMDDELLSHEDAWKLINLDTDGILTDIEIVGNKYRLNTDQMLQLMQQQIDKQKESILVTKAQAEQELRLLELSKARLKVNSAADVAHYQAKVAEIDANMKNMQGIIDESDYLLMELNGHLSITSRLADATAKSMQSAVKNFEAEIEAIDSTIDSLNDRKDILNDEKSELQDQLDILNEQKSVLEDTIKNYDAAASAIEGYTKSQVQAIQDQIDAMEEVAETIKKNYDDQIDALEEQNEERDDAIKKEKALADLQDAQKQKKRVYSSDRGWTYESSKGDILAAQKALADINNEMQIKALEKERDAKLDEIDSRKEAYTKQIKAYEEYAQKYADVASNIKQAENELLADQILGSDWRTKIEQKDEELLTKYSNEYVAFNTQLNNLVNNEIVVLQESIDAKDVEIKKIDEEIKAYNRYKTAVQNNLKEAKSALEEYEKNVQAVVTNTSNLMDSMENNIWNNHNKIIQWYTEIGDAAEELQSRLRNSPTGYGIVNSAWDAHLAGYANGGVNSTTGLAMLHGTKQKSETIFNAADSAKLYDLVHNTPNLISSMVKQASKLGGFSLNNGNSSSVNISIGQVVANNPQELTRNLDTHLDAYFRRKLTQSYVQ